MYEFHATVHASCNPATSGEVVCINGQELQTLAPSRAQLGQPFAISFEEAAADLQQLERMFFEPDGSFVWTSAEPQSQPWQVEGGLYDRNGRLLYVELWGSCPPAALDRLLSCLGWPALSLMFQSNRHAVYLDEQQFRRWAQR